MALYRYVAYDAAGRRLSRSVPARSTEQVKRMLWEQDLHVVEIRRHRRLPRLEELLPNLVGVGRVELIILTQQLAALTRAGIPILDSLAVLREQAESRLMRHALEEMMADLGAGAGLSEALARHPGVFPRLYPGMVRAAETGGELHETLRQLAAHLSREESAMRRARTAAIYPAIVVGLAVAVIIVLIGFVLPAFARLFADLDARPPMVTLALLAVGTFCRAHLPAILVGLAVPVGAGATWARTPGGQERMGALVIRLPMVGPIIRYTIVERCLRTLATLARAGVPIMVALEVAADAVGNAEFRRGLQSVREAALAGESLAVALGRTGLFPRMVVQIVRVGEETGRLETNLEGMAEHYAEEVDYRLRRLIAILEPALVVSVGVVVAFVAISVIAPMYALVHAIR
ncbi:MAG TPA: type II secretion system F family protein [Candidatus Dormibacteraeota bacterium]|nr:type II secretion system F family protein [Candidatus Dormibacteraeota bacterium]